jgi:hypothetical protein
MAPGEAVLDDGGWALSNRRPSSPDRAQERLQATAALIK